MSGAIGAMMFGAGGAPGVINAALPSGNASGVAPATATWQLNNDGTYSISTGQTGNWVTPATAAIAAGYQVKTDVTLSSFVVDPSAGAYIDLSTTRTWTIEHAGSTETVEFTVTIREKATGSVRSTQVGKTLTSQP